MKICNLCIGLMLLGFGGISNAHAALSEGATNEPIDSSNLDHREIRVFPQPSRERRDPILDLSSITPETLINIGKVLWPVIEAGRPVANIQTDWAAALPEGAKNWESLEGWQAPVSKPFSFKWWNTGFRMIQFDYVVVFTPGGRINGKGRYLANVSVIPAAVNVFWGYKFSAQAQVSKIDNTGTSTDPIAAMQLLLSLTIDTPLAHHQVSSDFYMTGAGEFKQLGEPETATTNAVSPDPSPEMPQ